MKAYFAIITLIITSSTIYANTSQQGYAVVKNDTIYGNIKINFAAGSIVVKQDSVNRMFLSGVQTVTLFGDNRITYYGYEFEDKTSFYKLIVPGKNPLIEKDDELYCVVEKMPAAIEEKLIYQLFGKKKVKEYTFIRNIALDDRAGLVDLFGYFNDYL